MAGLSIGWGLDFDQAAAKSWNLNFPESTIYRMWADRLVAMVREGGDKDRLKVDVLHLSPPCQYFSPAHTQEGEDDEMNSASLFACGDLIDVSRPRIVTLEQTFGILFKKFERYFNSLVRMFTDRGYSIRWTMVTLQRWVSHPILVTLPSSPSDFPIYSSTHIPIPCVKVHRNAS
jgi:DNA (cytosine-5)-methyltransferase 1